MSLRVCPNCGGRGHQETEDLSPRINRVNYERVHRALHALWTKAAVANQDYDRLQWRELDNAIDLLATDGMGPVKGGAPGRGSG